MKKIPLLLFAAAMGFGVSAQNIYPENDFAVPRDNAAPPVMVIHSHNWLSGLCVDVNAMGGMLTQRLYSVDPAANYPNALNTKISGLKFNKGRTHSIDAEASYYFDHEGRYGIGTGIMYMRQNGNLTLDNFHIEYKSVDNFGNTFRQSLTSDGQIKENTHTSNLNIPILFKYKKRFSRFVGFNADAGLLLNVLETSRYKTNASFDYEAIYQYAGTQGNITPVYDYQATPAPGDLLITKSQYLATVPGGNIDNYFNNLRNEGYNVGLGVKPNSNTGHVSDNTLSAGFLLRPQVSFFVTNNITVNAGVYYLFQDFSHNAPAGYRLTDKLGQYNPLLNSVTGSVNNSYGFTIGASYYFRNLRHIAVAPPVEDTSSIPPQDDQDDDKAAPNGKGDFSLNTSHTEISAPAQQAPETADKHKAYIQEH